MLIITLISLTYFLAAQFDLTNHVANKIVRNNIYSSSLLFVFLLISATVVAPITVLPIVPIFATAAGPALTAILSIIGWTLGAAVVFVVARRGLAPFIFKFFSKERLINYERFLPRRAEFFLLVLFRMVTPVEISSYLIAIFTSVSFGEYILGTIIGVAPFSFIFSYAGAAFFAGDTFMLFTLGIISLMIFMLAYFLLRRKIIL